MKPRTMDPLEFIPNYLCDQDAGLRDVVVLFLNRVLLEEVVVGIRNDGYREILSAKLADSEAKEYWMLMFEELKERGLSEVQLLVSDGHKGIQEAMKCSFLGVSWQMCTVHYTCNILKKLPKSVQGEIAASLREAGDNTEERAIFRKFGTLPNILSIHT